MARFFSLLLILCSFSHAQEFLRWAEIEAPTPESRAKLTELGFAIADIDWDRGVVGGLVNERLMYEITVVHGFSGQAVAFNRDGFDLDHRERPAWWSRARNFLAGDQFPRGYEPYTTYEELRMELLELEEQYPDLIKIHVIGKTTENRDILAIQINTSREDRERGRSDKPGIVYWGKHHAREILSSEVPRLFARFVAARYVGEQKGVPVADVDSVFQGTNTEELDSAFAKAIDERDIWIVPEVNPDGAIRDRTGRRFRGWRKNTKKNANGSIGVDLNRNYAHEWGGPGSSGDPRSDIYRGTEPFSELETQAVRDFLNERSVERGGNITTSLSFHSFSKLILWPPGYTTEPPEERVRTVYERLGKLMASWNGYKPMQSSKLYPASGVTSDYTHFEHGLWSFTFELEPASGGMRGFYPKPNRIIPAFQDNLKPCAMLLMNADDPSKPSLALPDGGQQHVAQ